MSLWDHGNFFLPGVFFMAFLQVFLVYIQPPSQRHKSVLPTFYRCLWVTCGLDNVASEHMQGWPSDCVKDPLPSNHVMAGGVTGGTLGGRLDPEDRVCKASFLAMVALALAFPSANGCNLISLCTSAGG